MATVAASVFVLQKWYNLKENCPVYHRRKISMLCDTLNVFDTAIEGEFLMSSGNFLAAPILQSANQIFLCGLATCTPARVETEKIHVKGLELRIARSTDSDY